MSNEILESDWKLLWEVQPVALGRFCDRVLAEVGRMAAASPKTGHARYLEVIALLKARDRELAIAFDDMRRSTAFRQLVSIRSLGLLTEEEFTRFSPELRGAVESLCGRGHEQNRTAGDP